MVWDNAIDEVKKKSVRTFDTFLSTFGSYWSQDIHLYHNQLLNQLLKSI